MTARPTIVLVHGAWADGSCWDAVIERLQADGYDVIAPQFPESSLAADVARLRQVLDRQDGPVLLAGHSYGGQIMTALGTDAPLSPAWIRASRSAESGHVAMVSHPSEVTQLIETAAAAVQAAG